MGGTCRTCAHYPKGVRKNQCAPCAAPIPNITPLLPASITSRHDWLWPPKPYYMGPNDGSGCPLWEKRQ